MKKELKKTFNSSLMLRALLDSFLKLNPWLMMKNPVLFVLETATVVILMLIIFPFYFNTELEMGYNAIVFFILLFTILFANFAEALAEGRGKAHADSLIKTRKKLIAKRIHKDGSIHHIAAADLNKGDLVLVEKGDTVPGDGMIIEGIAAVDESAITGESAFVIKQARSDSSSVTGGTTLVSDWIKVEMTAEPGASFLDQMISLVEGAKRQKSPNEIALNTLLVVLTIIFLIVVMTLYPLALYVGVHLQVFLNLSAYQFKQANIVKKVAEILRETGLNPIYLELEITESIAMQNAEQVILTLENLKQLGIQISIDDFGTGYSSLSYLRNFPIDRLKIDKSFVDNITVSAGDAVIAESIIAMAKSLKLEVIAEGVETEEQFQFLRSSGCHEMQGYFFSKPLPVERLTSQLSRLSGASGH